MINGLLYIALVRYSLLITNLTDMVPQPIANPLSKGISKKDKAAKCNPKGKNILTIEATTIPLYQLSRSFVNHAIHVSSGKKLNGGHMMNLMGSTIQATIK